MMAKKLAGALAQENEAGMKWNVQRRWRASQADRRAQTAPARANSRPPLNRNPLVVSDH
jgi:hypothetical protein